MTSFQERLIFNRIWINGDEQDQNKRYFDAKSFLATFQGQLVGN
jgi:hypothetical protein